MPDEKPKKLKEIVNEILNDMKSKSGTSFEERIKAYRNFENQNKEYDDHSIYTESDLVNYHETYKHLNSKIPEINEELSEKMIEKYIDTFLSKIHKNYDQILTEIEKRGLSKDEVKEFKERLFNLYVRDEKDNPMRFLRP